VVSSTRYWTRRNKEFFIWQCVLRKVLGTEVVTVLGPELATALIVSAEVTPTVDSSETLQLLSSQLRILRAKNGHERKLVVYCLLGSDNKRHYRHGAKKKGDGGRNNSAKLHCCVVTFLLSLAAAIELCIVTSKPYLGKWLERQARKRQARASLNPIVMGMINFMIMIAARWTTFS
jgi:hypothetical protein